MTQAPLSIRQQLENWRDNQPSGKQRKALEGAGLSDLYKTILVEEEGESSLKVQRSLVSPKIQSKLRVIGINVDETWVAMAKYTVDPDKDWFPDVKTRMDVIELFRPYYDRVGGEAQISRMYFDGKHIESIFRRGERMPGMDTLINILRFCVDDQREGGRRKTWDSTTLFFLEGQWNIFGRGNMPIPQLTGEEEFNDWFCQRVSHEQVDYTANKLNQALGTNDFSPLLLISWRDGKIPSREKYESLLRGINTAFPDWLALPNNGRAQAKGTGQMQSPKEPPAGEPARISPPTDASVSLPTLASILQEAADALRDLAKRAETIVVPEVSITQTPIPAIEPGETIDGFRFVLTQETFQRPTIFTLEEVEDSEILIGELARRLALINSMSPTAKRSVLVRLRKAFDELFIQVRHMDATQDDLPAMFREMRLIAGHLSGNRES
jgi:hypothetical protein